ncbi:GroES-like protein [Mycena indigotica]|uniref:GroES-like protein n=1 Tax=Mycena indigotica TaxID=2126181 RepID=A0A8H6TG83_9AGAR|nr:GroES-like protein [Mycena indigotica]KAF7316106.1 GroES-like protein [Mycena indigotica]
MSVPTQTAVVIETPKAPFIVKSGIAIPKPAAGQVLLKVMAVGLNPMDPMRRSMNMLIDSYPAILGSDIAGVIEEVGQGVQGWKKGDEVFCSDTAGGYQQYHVINEPFLIRKPANVSFDQLATVLITGCTSLNGLYAPSPIGLGLNPTFSSDKPQSGKSAFVLGAATSCGQYAIQYLKLAGFTRIVAYASGKHTEYLASLGATAIIARESTTMVDLVSHPAISAAPFDVVFDALLAMASDAASALDIAHDIVKPNGQLATVNPRSVLSPDRLAQNKGVELVRAFGYYVGPDGGKPPSDLGFGAKPEHTAFGKLIKEHLPRLLETGQLLPNRVEVLPNGLAGIVKGLGRWTGGEGVSGVKLYQSVLKS